MGGGCAGNGAEGAMVRVKEKGRLKGKKEKLAVKNGETAMTGCGLGEKMRKMVREADEA